MSISRPCRYPSLANPRVDGPTDLPRLLRRLADLIEELGVSPMEILDLTIESDIIEDGPWWSGTLYWATDADGVEEDETETALAEPPVSSG